MTTYYIHNCTSLLSELFLDCLGPHSGLAGVVTSDIKAKAGDGCEACCRTSRTAVAGFVGGGCSVCGKNSAEGSVVSTEMEAKVGGGFEVSGSNSRTAVAGVASTETEVKTGGGCCRSNSQVVVVVTTFKEKTMLLEIASHG